MCRKTFRMSTLELHIPDTCFQSKISQLRKWAFSVTRLQCTGMCCYSLPTIDGKKICRMARFKVLCGKAGMPWVSKYLTCPPISRFALTPSSWHFYECTWKRLTTASDGHLECKWFTCTFPVRRVAMLQIMRHYLFALQTPTQRAT